MADAMGVLPRRIGCGVLYEGDDPSKALRESVELVAPVWVVDWYVAAWPVPWAPQGRLELEPVARHARWSSAICQPLIGSDVQSWTS